MTREAVLLLSRTDAFLVPHMCRPRRCIVHSGLGQGRDHVVYQPDEGRLVYGMGLNSIAAGGVNFPGDVGNPILAGVGSVSTEQLVKRIRPSRLLRWSQPMVLLALLGAGAGDRIAEVAVALGAFGLAVGALDASMNMLGVSLQRSYGRSIMLSFHAAYSLGGILGASLAWVGAHWHLALWVSYLPVVAVLLPATLIGSRWYVDGGTSAVVEEQEQERAQAQGVVFKLLLPLCLVMTFAYIGDSTVSNWSAKYLKDVHKDPWGKDFTLRCPGQKDPESADVSSSGPDKQDGTADDIKSWE